MRKKIIAFGLSAVTAGTFAFAIAAPAAHANVVTDVCAALPGLNATSIGNLATATGQANVAASALAAKLSDVNAATSAYTAALIADLQALAAGTNTTVTTAVLSGAQTDLANKFVAWANADADNYTAQQALQAATMQANIITGLINQLCSVEV